MDLAAAVYAVTDKCPTREQFGLTQQARRSAVSIPSNIAEGQARGATNDYIRFLRIARGSVQELETQLLLMVKIGHLPESDVKPLLNQSSEVTRLLSGLERSLRNQGA
jgi:four helix bundle protein